MNEGNRGSSQSLMEQNGTVRARWSQMIHSVHEGAIMQPGFEVSMFQSDSSPFSI